MKGRGKVKRRKTNERREKQHGRKNENWRKKNKGNEMETTL